MPSPLPSPHLFFLNFFYHLPCFGFSTLLHGKLKYSIFKQVLLIVVPKALYIYQVARTKFWLPISAQCYWLKIQQHEEFLIHFEIDARVNIIYKKELLQIGQQIFVLCIKKVIWAENEVTERTSSVRFWSQFSSLYIYSILVAQFSFFFFLNKIHLRMSLFEYKSKTVY